MRRSFHNMQVFLEGFSCCLEQLFCRKPVNVIKDVCLIIFQVFHNSNISNVLSKMREEIFLEAFS